MVSKDMNLLIEREEEGWRGGRDPSCDVVRGDGMCTKRVNSDAEWLMAVVRKGKGQTLAFDSTSANSDHKSQPSVATVIALAFSTCPPSSSSPACYLALI